MSYTINGTNLKTTYGFHGQKADGSNLALSGAWDLPERSGKTSHQWAEAQAVEGYVSSGDIRLKGRDIKLQGLIMGSNESDLLTKVKAFTDFLSGLTALATLAHSDWGSWSVLVKSTSPVIHADKRYATISLHLREPVVPTPSAYVTTYDPTDQSAENAENIKLVDGIDGDTFDSLGVTLLKLDKFLDYADPQDMHFTAYDSEGYQITKPEGNKLVLNAFLKAVNYTTLKSNLTDLYALFSTPGLRYLTNGSAAAASVWADKGFQVSRMLVQTGQSSCLIKMELHFNYYS